MKLDSSFLKIVCLTLIPLFSNAQQSKFQIYTSFATQGTDERIFALNESARKSVIELNNDKNLPSLSFDTGIEYKMLEISNFEIKAGLRYTYEWNNSYRNYNHCVIQQKQEGKCNYYLLYVDDYGYHSVGPTLEIDKRFRIYDKLNIKIGTTLTSMFRFLSYYDSKYKYLWNFEFLNSEILPKVSLEKKNYEVGIYGRAWQIRKVDRIIYPTFSSLGHPSISESYFSINPWKIGVLIKYKIVQNGI